MYEEVGSAKTKEPILPVYIDPRRIMLEENPAYASNQGPSSGRPQVLNFTIAFAELHADTVPGGTNKNKN